MLVRVLRGAADRRGGESGPRLRPALVSGQWIGQMAYWIGPILGAIVAAVLWEKLLLPKATD